jgi:hypothetical protein
MLTDKLSDYRVVRLEATLKRPIYPLGAVVLDEGNATRRKLPFVEAKFRCPVGG